MKLKVGVYWFHVVLTSDRPSVCPSVRLSVDKNRVHSVSSTIPAGSFHICTSYPATSEAVSRVKVIVKFKNLNFWKFFGICKFHFVLLWHGIWNESIVWVIMGLEGGGGVFWEYRHSSCSSCILIFLYVTDKNLVWVPQVLVANQIYCKTSNISCTLLCNKIVDYSDVVDLTPGFNGFGKDNCKKRRESFDIWCDLNKRFHGSLVQCYFSQTASATWEVAV